MSQAGLISNSSELPSNVPITFQTSSGSATASNNVITFAGASGITLSASGSTVTITGGTSFTWSTVTASTLSMVSNNGYIANYSGQLACTLPTTSNVGDIITITNINTAAGWKITYTTNQEIFIGSTHSTVTSGSLAATALGDTITMVCLTANLTWQVISMVGNITVA